MLPGVTPAATNILMTTDAVGGVWHYALDLARGLAPAGAKVTLAVLGPMPDAVRLREAQAVAGLELIDTGLPLDWLAEGPDAVRRAGRALARLAATRGADLVHLNSPALAADARFDVPVLAVQHSCVATWWAAVRGGPLPADFRWRAALTGRGLRRADAVAAPSAAFAEASRVVHRLDRAPAVVWNGRAVVTPPEVPTGGWRPMVFTCGRLWDEGKNLAALDRAAARLAAPVVAAGPVGGPNGTALDGRHLTLAGNLPPAEVRAVLAGRPVYASTARYEPFGLAVLEAAQAGCALVLADIPTFRELWNDAAVFVPPDDDAEIAAALSRLLADREERFALGMAACRRARRYTVDAMAAGTLALYCPLVERRPVPAGEAAVA